LTETGLLGLLGGGLGIALAHVVVRVSRATLSGTIPLQERIQLGLPVLAGGLVLAIGAGALIGLLPALRITKVDLRATVQQTSTGFTERKGRARLRSVLVSAQIAVALILLVAGGLLLRSFANLQNVESGLDPESVLIASIPISGSAYPDELSRKSFYDELVRRLEAHPDVRRAAAVAFAPFSGSWSDGGLEIDGEAFSRDVEFTEFQVASPGYFETMGIPLVIGRDFNRQDAPDGPRVAIVNQTIAQRHFPNGDALGHQIRPAGDDSIAWSTIVGVVGDVTHRGLNAPPTAQMYTPYSQSPGGLRMPVALRSDGDPASVIGAVREIVAEMDANVPASTAYPLQERIDQSVAGERFLTWLLGSFAATALLLAIVGIYGVVAHAVSLRTHEFGIRKALGADSNRVVRDVVRGSAVVISLGLAAGLVAALALASALESFLFGVTARDPLVFGVVTVALGAAAVLATWIPASCAGRLDPMEALRKE
jgi:predicted permease